jgi:hypothetical protein
MKQLSFYFLIALCCISIHAKAQSCALDQVGTTTVSPTSTLADMAIDGNNKVYSLAYNGTTKVIELKSATVSSSWTLVATVPTVTNTTVKPALAINKIGEIFAFIRDEPNGKVGKVYKSTGGAFTQVGGPISVGPVSDLSIAFASTNEIYIAYTDVVPSNLATVKRWNGSAWLDVGPGGIASIGASKFNSLIIDNTNTPILAYQDDDMGLATTVSKFNGTSWNPFFTSASGPTSSTTLRCATNGDYYLGYIEGSDASVVQKYDGSSWNQLGFPLTGLSSGSGNYELDIDPANSPYIIAATTSSMVTAYRFDGGTGWLQVPAGFINTNISTMVNIAFDRFGAPYFGYVDVPNNNALNVKTLTSLVSITAQPTSTTLCNGNSGVFSITTAGPGSPSYNWQSNNSSGFAYVVAPYSQSINILNVTANPTVNQDKIRCVVDIGCRNVISNTATLTVSSPSVSTTFTNPTCFNTGNGSINANVSGGISPYTYSWSPVGGNVSSPINLFWNTYTLNTSDANGCATSTVVNLTSPPSISTSFSGNMNICAGSNTSLTITAIGGSGSFTYTWTPSTGLSSTTSSVVTANPSSTQTYNVQAIDGLGCVETNTVMVNVNSVPTLTANASLTSICNGNSTNLSVTGTGADTYVWNPGNLAGASHIVSPTSTTIYTVVGTNTLTGCTASANVTITVNPLPTVNAGPTRTLTCANTFTTLAGSTTGGVSFNWIGPGIVSGGTTLNPTINAPGTYDLSVISSFGCSAGPSPVTVFTNTTPPSPTASTTGTLTCSSLTVALNGTPGTGVTYQWTGPGFSGGTTSQNAVANAAGSFTLRVTNAINGCTNTAVTSVSQNTTTPTLSASTSSSSICAGSTTTLSATGVGVNTYVWQPGSLAGATRTVSPASTTIYTVTGTNTVTGCSASANITITVNPLPTITAGPTKSLTCASSFTTVTCSSVGGTSYNWTGPSIISGYTTTNCNVGAAGIYTVFAISPFFCNSTPTTVIVVSNTTPPTATASSSGSITCVTSTVALTGGPGTGVTYQWSGASFSGGTTSQNAVADAAGTYTLKVTSSVNSCTNAATTVVNQNTVAPIPSASTTGTLTCSAATVALNGTPATGVTYLWSGPSVSGPTTTQNTNANAAGSYTLRVTSATNGCTNTAVTNVTQNTINPTANAGMDQNLTCSSPSVTLSGSASPSTCTPVWTGGVTSGSNSYNATASNAGTYTLTVTDPNNGCTSTDEVSVTANAGIPTITVSISNTLTCLTSTANTSASTSASSPTYLWSGPSVVSGNNTPNAIIDQPGTYTVIVTEIATGCSAFATINASQDISLPNITISSSSSVICSGSSSNLTSNGATSYTWSTSQNTSSISVSPNTTSSFTVSGTGTNGCINSAIATITVNTTPTLAVIGNTNICKGSSSTLTGSGATSYTWSSGASTSSISVSPTVTTTYTLNGDNGNGCSSSMPITVSIIPNKSISGVITSTAGVTTGDVILYKYTVGLSKWDSITIVPFTSSYSFTNIDSALYVVRAIPSATNIQVTYGDNAISWQNATIINHGCSNNSSQNIGLVGLETYTAGPGVLTGSIVEEDGFGQRINQEFKPLVPGTPIGGIVVKGGKNPGGQMFVQTITDAAGQYTLTGLPLNTANESYFVFVDIPGLDTNGTYHVVISGSNTVYNGLNFTVDSMHINPIGNITSINSQEAILENNIFVYPNPSRDVVTIKYKLNTTSKVSIGLYNSVGEKLQVISPLITEEKGNIEHSINLKEFSNGVYFIKFSINNTDNYIKLIKID